MKINGKVFVVTGAGSGIGRELVLALLGGGARVAGVDLSADRLEETAERAGAGARFSLHAANVTDKAAVAALPEAVAAHHGAVDGVINCAGIIQPFVTVDALKDSDIERVIEVNLWGTIHVTRAFLPVLKARPEAHLVNVSSMGGFIPFPGQTVYSATKGAVRLLTEGLYAEARGSGLSVSVVFPGAVATDISKNSGAGMDGADAAEGKALPAPEAARIIVAGIEKGKLHILVGRDAKMLWLLSRLAPGAAIRMIQKAMKKFGH